jgi:hypothetical protein
MRARTRLVILALLTPLITAPGPAPGPRATAAAGCALPYRVSRDEMLQAMATHGAYSLTATTTAMRFGTEALLKLVHRRQQEAPGITRLFIDQSDWFTAHRETAGVGYDEMSQAARSGFEHHQDVTVLTSVELLANPSDPVRAGDRPHRARAVIDHRLLVEACPGSPCRIREQPKKV